MRFKNLNKEWNITFCENTEIATYYYEGKKLTYIEQHNPKFNTIVYIIS